MKKSIFTLLVLAFLACCIACDPANIPEDLENKVYKVSYENSKGPAPSEIEVKIGTVLTDKELPEITTEGFDFKGWFDDETQAIPDKYIVIKDVKLVAHWIDQSNPEDNENNNDDNNNTNDDNNNETNNNENVPELADLTIKGEPATEATISWTNPSNENLSKVVVAASCESVSKYEYEDFSDSATFTINSELLTAGQSSEYTFPVKMYAKYSITVSAFSSDQKKIAEKKIDFTTKMVSPKNDENCTIVAIPLTSVFYISKEDSNSKFRFENGIPRNGSGDNISWHRLFQGSWTKVLNSDSWSGPLYVPNNSDYFYLMHCTDLDGKNFYSNILEVNTDETLTEKIGYIAYSDGTISKTFNSAKTPVGIVCQVDKDGKATRIVNLKQGNSLKWCASSSVEGYSLKSETGNVTNITSVEDGSNNWAAIKAAVTDSDDPDNYPYFAYVDNLDSSALPDGCKWYAPARDELAQMALNKEAINKAIENIKTNGYTGVCNSIEFPLGSSTMNGYNKNGISVWGIYAGNNGFKLEVTPACIKTFDNYGCRAISKWIEK